MGCWIYKEKECLEIQPEGFVGFVYKITLMQDTPLYKAGTIYIGKKIFTFRKKTKLSKRARKGTRKRVSITQIDSQWLTYCGSNLELKALVKEVGIEKFRREVLHLCRTKTEMSYLEVKEQINYKVLEIPSFNKWISARILKQKLWNTTVI